MDWAKLFQIASYIVAGASVALAGIAPLTKNTKDDRLLAVLKWLLAKLSLNVKP